MTPPSRATRRLAGACALALVACALASTPRSACAEGRLESLGKATGFLLPAAGAGVTVVVNGMFIAYGEGSPRVWRMAGYLFGGVELAIGTGLVIAGPETSYDWTLVALPLALGVGAVATSFFAPIPDDVVGGDGTQMIGLAPMLVPGGGGGMVFAGRF